MQYVEKEDGTISWPLFRDPWPNYDPQQFGVILRPIRLYGTNPESFTLMTAGPTITPLVRILRAYGRLIENLPQCIAAMHLWATSLNCPAFNPLCLALMAIRGVQVNPGSSFEYSTAQTNSVCSVQMLDATVSRSRSARLSGSNSMMHIPLRIRATL